MKSLLIIFAILYSVSFSFAENDSENQKTDIVLSSGYVTSTNESFIVEQDDLLRIIDIFKKYQSTAILKSMIVFHVQRKDKRFYETTNISDVFADPNIPGKEIIKLTIELRISNTNKLKFPESESYLARVEFNNSSKPKIIISVLGTDRGWALKLSDELDPQIKRTINDKETSLWLIILIVILIYDFLESLKIKFIENVRVLRIIDGFINSTFLGILILILFLLDSVFGRTEILIKLFGPVSGFAWGEFNNIIKDYEGTRNNVFWGVIVAVIVSIVSNFIGPFAIYKNLLKRDKNVD